MHICSARSIGGGEKHVASLVNGLSRRGHEVFVAVAPDSPVISMLDEVSSENIIQLTMRNAISLRSALKLAKFARERKVEIIHAHLGRDYPLAAVAAGRSGARLILTRHVMFPLGRVHRLVLRRTARVIAVSEAVADALRSQRIFNPAIIRVIHNGVDTDRFAAEAPKRKNETRLRVGTIGELAPVKRQEDLIRAAQHICRERDDVEFVIEGEDKSPTGENRQRLLRLIAELQLEQRVHLSGWSEDIATLMASLDVFVSTSESESFGMAIVEAMAAGLAVVATATPGACEIMKDNVTGRLIAIRDVHAIAKAIGELVDSPEERARLGANARVVARERFDSERMIDETVKLYEEVMLQTS